MKKIISAILLSAFYVFAQSNSNSNENDEYYHAHKGFYFSVNTGIVLANLSQKTTSFPDKNVEKEKENSTPSKTKKVHSTACSLESVLV